MTENGLMGYYFKDNGFSKTRFIGRSLGNKLTPVLDDTVERPLREQKIGSVRWIGYIKVNQSGDYKFSTQSSVNCILQVNGVLFQETDRPAQVSLDAGKSYYIRIEHQLESTVTLYDFEPILLFQENNSQRTQVTLDQLFMPDFGNIDDSEFIPQGNFFSNTTEQDILDVIDSDRDGIPDDWEIKGYTVINGNIVKWDSKYEEEGYIKYVSNPHNARTANDPYTDSEKVTGLIDKSVSLNARDPMVAAFPSIGVSMEKLVVSKNATLSTQAGTSMSKSTSSSFTDSNTEGVSSTFGISGLEFNASVTASYSHSSQSTNSVSDTSGKSFVDGLNLSTASAAYIDPNIRYYNSGTAPVYNLSPNITISIDDDSITTIQAQASQMANFLNPGDYYPKQSLHPIALNTMDQFNSHFIPININQLKKIDKLVPTILSVAGFNGLFGKIDINGSLTTERNSWGPYIGQIISTTASFTLELFGKTKEMRFAARDFNDPTDYTPILTIEDVLKRYFNIIMQDGQILVNGEKLLPRGDINFFMDKFTNDYIKEQGIKGKTFLQTPICRCMNIGFVVKLVRGQVIINDIYNISLLSQQRLSLRIGTNAKGEIIINDDLNQHIQTVYAVKDDAHYLYLVNGFRADLRKSKVLAYDPKTKTVIKSDLDREDKNQLWFMSQVENNREVYKISRFLDQSEGLDVENTPVPMKGTKIIIKKMDSRSETQKWLFKDTGDPISNDPTYILSFHDRNKALTVVNKKKKGDSVARDYIVLSTKNGSAAQKWVPVYIRNKDKYIFTLASDRYKYLVGDKKTGNVYLQDGTYTYPDVTKYWRFKPAPGVTWYGNLGAFDDAKQKVLDISEKKYIDGEDIIYYPRTGGENQMFIKAAVVEEESS